MDFSPSAHFFRNPQVSLKVCGVTVPEDAHALVEMGIGALGVNFWEQSKRYCPVQEAESWLKELNACVLRVGVFVNAPSAVPRRLLEEGIIDMAQFHGDEDADYCLEFAREALPFMKAFGVKDAASLRKVTAYNAHAVLLDAPAPGTYGGTGTVFDWNLADMFVRRYKSTPTFLAGGITVDNAGEAAEKVRPAYIDVASGSERSPGVKDLEKCRILIEIVQSVPRARDEEEPPLTTLI